MSTPRSRPSAAAVIIVALLIAAASVSKLRRPGMAAPNEPTLDFVATPADNLSGIAYDGNSLWLTVDGAGLIHEVNPETLKIKRTFSFPSKATGGSSWDGHNLWQIAYQDRTISRINPKSGDIDEVIPSPGEGQCSGMTFDGRYLWVANFDEERIYQIDPQNNGAIIRWVAGNHELTGMAWDGRSLWFGIVIQRKNALETDSRLGVVEQMNLPDQEIVGSFPVAGVGPGTSDWIPGRNVARVFWWYDGYHHRLARLRLSGRGGWKLLGRTFEVDK